MSKDQQIHTEYCLATAEEIYNDKDKPKLLTFERNKLKRVMITDMNKIGYRKMYNFPVFTEHPILINDVLVKSNGDYLLEYEQPLKEKK